MRFGNERGKVFSNFLKWNRITDNWLWFTFCFYIYCFVICYACMNTWIKDMFTITLIISQQRNGNDMTWKFFSARLTLKYVHQTHLVFYCYLLLNASQIMWWKNSGLKYFMVKRMHFKSLSVMHWKWTFLEKEKKNVMIWIALNIVSLDYHFLTFTMKGCKNVGLTKMYFFIRHICA